MLQYIKLHTVHCFISGEKALEASKIMRQHQVSEYNDASESARKVDCLFKYEDLELSNIKFKKPDTSNRDLAIQNRKNVRQGRQLQSQLHYLKMLGALINFWRMALLLSCGTLL